RLRLVRHAVARPGFQCGMEGVGQRVLGSDDVARACGDESQQAAVTFARRSLDRPPRRLGHSCCGTRFARNSSLRPGSIGKRRTHSSALERSGTSMMITPASCSLVSAKGPSCTCQALPDWLSTVAVAGASRPAPPTNTPASLRALR